MAFSTLLIYFGAGFLLDILITLYTQEIVKKRAESVAVLTFIITMLNLVIYEKIILSTDFLSFAISFAIGCACGAFAIVALRK